MPLLELNVPGDPVAKGRPRLGKNGHAFTPERTRLAEKTLTDLAIGKLAGQVPAQGPVGIACEFYCATQRKTDGDNLLKLVTDALNGVAFVDDSQIVEYFARVHRGVGKANAWTRIFVYEV